MRTSKTEAEVMALPKTKVYFGKAVEEAIIKYNTLTDDYERNRLYEAEIHVSLSKLCECITNRFNFPYITESKEIIKHDVLTHLVKALHLYKADKGKAYSYFSSAAKNYLIQWNKKSQKQALNHSLDGFSERMEHYDIHNACEDTNVELIAPTKNEENDALLEYIVVWFQKNCQRLYKLKSYQDCCLDICKGLTLDKADWFDAIYLESPIVNSRTTGRRSFVRSIESTHKHGVYTRVIRDMRSHYKKLSYRFWNQAHETLRGGGKKQGNDP
jgi:hypothetical protein